jgi:hypothetical protein
MKATRGERQKEFISLDENERPYVGRKMAYLLQIIDRVHC